MSIELMIYLAGLFSKLEAVAVLFCATTLIGSIVYLIARSESYQSEKDDFDQKWGPKLKRAYIAVLFLLTLSVVLPSQKTMLLMTATSVTKEVVKNESIQSLYSKSIKLLEDKIDEELEKKSK